MSSEIYGWRKLERNWEKYEEAAGTETETDMHAADYTQLLKATCVYSILSFTACHSHNGFQMMTTKLQKYKTSFNCLYITL